MTPGLVVIPVCVRHVVFVRHTCRHLVVGHKGHGVARHGVVGVLDDVGALTLAFFDQWILGTGDPGVFRHVDAILGQGQQVFLPDAVLVPAGVPVAEVLGIVGRVVVVKLMQVEDATGVDELVVGIVGTQIGVQMETVGKVYFLARLGVEEINGSGILLYLQQLEVGDTHAAVLRAFVQSLAVVGRDGEAYVAECLVGVDSCGEFFGSRTPVCEVNVRVGIGERFPRHAVPRYLDMKCRRMQFLAEIADVQVCGRILLLVSGASLKPSPRSTRRYWGSVHVPSVSEIQYE